MANKDKFLPSTITVELTETLLAWCSSFLTMHWYTPPWLWVTVLIWRVEVAVWLSSLLVIVTLNWTPFGVLHENIKFNGASPSLVAVHVIWNSSPNTTWSCCGGFSTVGRPVKICYSYIIFTTMLALPVWNLCQEFSIVLHTRFAFIQLSHYYSNSTSTFRY